MQLKIGITGFNPVTKIQDSEIKKLVEKINLTRSFKVVQFVKPQANSNYFRLSLVNIISDEKFEMLLNAHYNYLSVAANENFIELPEELKPIIEDFEYLSPSDLNTKLKQKDFSQLGRLEIEQIEYWQSETFGEVIFNMYD